MEESNLRNASLLSWTLQVYKDFKRGVQQSAHEAAIGRAMQHHKEWWGDWEAFDRGSGVEDGSTTNRLIHIHHDASIRLQLENKQPREVGELYQSLLDKGFTEFESIHTLAVGLSEEFSYAREHSEDFQSERFVGRATGYVKEALSRPNLTRTSKLKAY